MITPEDIVRRAERKYRDILRAWLLDENPFPLELSTGRVPQNLVERRQQIAHLREKSREVCGTGYTLEWKTINTQTLGKQTMPTRVIIETLDDYLTLLRKRTEFNAFTTDVLKIRQKFPELEAWMHVSPQDVVAYHDQWDNLLTVCDYFVKKPRPTLYIRELPIAVHTKFIETHSRILRDLLDRLLPLDAIDSSTQEFNARFGLKEKPALVRLRLLEEQLDWEYGVRIDDLSLPINQMAHLLADHIKPQHVIIVENLINFLTLPRFASSIGLFGGGFGVHLLRGISWLSQCDIIYWDDIDAHGFEILSDLRGMFPHTRSSMMDFETLNAHFDYIVDGKRSISERFEHLTETESRLVQHVLEHDLRLEQEHISQDYAIECLKMLLRGTEMG